MSLFFEFDQNNTGGSFDIDDRRGIGPHVWIEANTVKHATELAERLGLYWDGVENDRDCPCCGDRWYRPSHNGGQASLKVSAEWDFYWHDTVYVHRPDGTLSRLKAADLRAAGRA